MLRQAIEAEQKVLHELVLHGDTFHVDKRVYMYEPPASDKGVGGPPLEVQIHTQFSVAQLEQLTTEFRAAYPDFIAPHGQMTALLHGLSAVATGTSLLPGAWLSLPVDKVAQLMAALGHGPTVDWRQLIVAAMNLPVALPEDIFGVAQALVEDREQFVAQEFWFDKIDADDTFPRAAACKGLLFDLFCDAGAGGSRTIDPRHVALWLCRCVDDVHLAVRTALSIIAATPDGPVPVDAPIDRSHTAAVLNYDASTTTDSSNPTDADPVGEVALATLWKELGGTCTVEELLQHPEVAHCVETKFARVDVRRFSHVQLASE